MAMKAGDEIKATSKKNPELVLPGPLTLRGVLGDGSIRVSYPDHTFLITLNLEEWQVERVVPPLQFHVGMVIEWRDGSRLVRGFQTWFHHNGDEWRFDDNEARRLHEEGVVRIVPVEELENEARR